LGEFNLFKTQGIEMSTASPTQFSLAFLGRQVALICVVLALGKYWIWLGGREGHLELGDESANWLHLLMGLLVCASGGGFAGGFFSRARTAAILAGVVAIAYGILTWMYVTSCEMPTNL
jgi:uncharacterized membrane protein HdeD (DUF308 family)